MMEIERFVLTIDGSHLERFNRGLY